LPQAAIAHDKFHIEKYLNEAVDQVRKSENRRLQKADDKTLVGARYLYWYRPENLPEHQRERFAELQTLQLDVGRAWNLKELFREFWKVSTAEAAKEFFASWFAAAEQSKLAPVIKVAQMLKQHLASIITYWEHRISNGFAEGVNSVIQAVKTAARGFRNFANYRAAILFYCGALALFP
jgi:transposase